jgi:lipoprotein NlpI
MVSVVLVGLCLLQAGSLPARAEQDKKIEELLKQVDEAWSKGERDRAVRTVGKAIELEPKNSQLYLLRASLYEEWNKHEQAIADFSVYLKLDPKNAQVYNRRGSEQFKVGKIKESVEDFDRALELNPDGRNGHWKRGISLYYLGRFEDGKKQFEGYEKVSTTDVENAVWHFLCNARLVGVEKARPEILKIGKDRRVPMMVIYELFKGQAKPEDVLAAAEAGKAEGELRKQQLFYAHLYLGIYFDILGDKKKALAHLTDAAGKYRISHYMGDVAHVHEQILRKELQEK